MACSLPITSSDEHRVLRSTFAPLLMLLLLLLLLCLLLRVLWCMQVCAGCSGRQL
jgi:hypothetical protein